MFTRCRLALAALLLTAAAPGTAGPDPYPDPEVDLQLVLAADASGSMTRALARTQRVAFAQAFRTPRIANAVGSGPMGRIAVTYFEWSGPGRQSVIVPWTILATPQDMDRFADTLLAAPDAVPGGDTSISAALLFAQRQIAANGLTSFRTVIDLSANGRNSAGPPLGDAHALLCASRLTVNAIVLPPPHPPGDYDAIFQGYDGALSDYYSDEVTCGPGAFVEAVGDDWNMASAILRKLVFEIAWAQ